MTHYIYENPAYPLPELARWMAKSENGSLVIFHYKPDGAIGGHDDFPSGWIPSREDPDVVWDYLRSQHYAIGGPWFDSLRRIIRLGDPAYYTAANEHTDKWGRLPHNGGPAPSWTIGKHILVLTRSLGEMISEQARWQWGQGSGRPLDVIAYRVIGEDSDSLANKMDRAVRESCPGKFSAVRDAGDGMPDAFDDLPDDGGSLPEPDVPEFLRHWRPKWGSEGREAGDPIPSSSRSRLDFYTDEEVKHRNELAAHLGVPVPGMSEWLREPLREARRVRYREAAMTGFLASGHIEISPPASLEDHAFLIASAMLDQEKEGE